MGDSRPDNLHGGDGGADEDGAQYNKVDDGGDREEVGPEVIDPYLIGGKHSTLYGVERFVIFPPSYSWMPLWTYCDNRSEQYPFMAFLLG